MAAFSDELHIGIATVINQLRTASADGPVDYPAAVEPSQIGTRGSVPQGLLVGQPLPSIFNDALLCRNVFGGKDSEAVDA